MRALTSARSWVGENRARVLAAWMLVALVVQVVIAL